MQYQYQTFPDAKGMVDSVAKLRALQLPPLVGKSFLDVGCNEGFYCGVAIDAGASRVVGLDSFDLVVERARQRYPSATFLHQSWDVLPDDIFDVILFASSMHYIPTEAGIVDILTRLIGRLSAEGLFILEAGVIEDGPAEIIAITRSDGAVYYPTMALMASIFDQAGIAWRRVGSSISGDSIVRSVFHCRKRRPVALIVRGRPNTGKSYFTRAFLGLDRARVVQLDLVSMEIYNALYPGESINTSILSATSELIRQGGVEAATHLASVVVDRLKAAGAFSSPVEGNGYIIEGLNPAVGEDNLAFLAIRQSLTDAGFAVWDLEALTQFEPNYWSTVGNMVDCGGYLLPFDLSLRTAITTAAHNGDYLSIEGVSSDELKPISRALLLQPDGAVLAKADVVQNGSKWRASLRLVDDKKTYEAKKLHVILITCDYAAVFPDRPAFPDWPFPFR